ncbi:uncharacterized protein RCO7_07016 [Rhynchosporium graminicola]|uniref:Rhodopsin domain-containing protein n=1 Tax=Rhynchosporium graminicola TaxID=2792576 RepID=A0A1E1K0G2_9HELO|nr:uncharacterized protein RCO7_07016 [Rhynchosporium commune]
MKSNCPVAVWKSDGRFSQDDWVMVVINFFLLIFATLGSLCVAYGFGLDAWDVGNLPLALGIFFWDELVYILILGLSKIAIITFYLRIFPYKRIRITCYVLLAWVALNTTLFMLTALLQCVPISLNYFGWGKDGGRKRCLSLNAQAYASAAINITQDVVILLLPIPWLFRLRVSLKQKIHVIFMFSLGFFICVCSIVRICKVHKFSDDSRNPTRDFVDAIYWTAIEIYVSVIIPNLPSMRSLLARRFPTIFGLDIQNVGYRNYEPSNLPAPSCRSYEQSSRVDASHTPEDVEMGSTSTSRDKTSSHHIAREVEGDGYFNNSRMGNGRWANL